MSLETSRNIWGTENKKFKEKLRNLRNNLKEKDGYLKHTLRILGNRSRRNNIRVQGIPGCDYEGLDVTEEKLRKVIKERAHGVKRNYDDNDNNDRSSNQG